MLLLLSFVLFNFVCAGSIDSQLTFASTDSRWTRRSSHIGSFSFTFGPTSWTGTWWNSLSTKVSNTSFEGDYLWGSLYVGTGWMPTNWVSYFSADVDVHRNVSNPDKFDWLNFTVELSSGFIASAYIGLQEKTPDGTVVRTLPFNQILPTPVLWNYNVTKSVTRSNPAQGLYVSVYDGAVNFDPVAIELTYVFSNQGGVLDLTPRVTVVPQAIESFLTVSNWRYADTSNTLSFLMVTGSSKGSFTAGGTVLAAGTGSSRTFIRLADSCLADGKVQKTIVNYTVSARGLLDFNNPSVRLQLQAKYDQNVQVTFWETIFPANAQVITYDPSAGTGPDPWTTTNVGLIVGLTILAFVLFIAVLIGLYYIFQKRVLYDTVK